MQISSISSIIHNINGVHITASIKHMNKKLISCCALKSDAREYWKENSLCNLLRMHSKLLDF